MKRFEREARAASALNHQNIITIYDIGQDNGLHFIAAERVIGQTLRQKLAGEPMNPREAMAIASQIAAGLAAAHEAGVVHRDIKPENVMARPDGQVKILDFGLAKLIDYETLQHDAPAQFSGDQSETRAGLTNFVSDRILYFAWSRDGSQLALTRLAMNREIITIGNFK